MVARSKRERENLGRLLHGLNKFLKIIENTREESVSIC